MLWLTPEVLDQIHALGADFVPLPLHRTGINPLRDMVNTTNHLNFSIEGIAVTNLPFHLLQLLFFKLFVVSWASPSGVLASWP